MFSENQYLFFYGVGFTFLLKGAHDVLGDRAIAVTASSRSFPEREAWNCCRENGITRVVCKSDKFGKLLQGDACGNIHHTIKNLGFSCVTLDLGGYRTGSMNETLTDIEKE